MVETVTSGAVVTIRSASAPPSRAISFRICPKAICVETGLPRFSATGSAAGTATRAALSRRGPPAKNGAPFAARSSPAASASPSQGSNSCPGRTPSAARSASICAGVISPAWLSLCPASGSPRPLIV